jgi:hypothetical protein
MRPKDNCDRSTLSAFHHLMNSTSTGNLLNNTTNKDFITASRNNNNTELNFQNFTYSSSLMRKLNSKFG